MQGLIALYRLGSRRLGAIYGVAARPDFIAAVAAMLGVLVFDTLPGLFIGIAVSFLLLLYRSARPHIAVLGRAGMGTDGEVWVDVERHPGSQQVPGVVVLRVEGGLFFADAEAVSRSVRAHAAREGTGVVVRGVLRRAEAGVPSIGVYPTVRQAVQALAGRSPGSATDRGIR